MSTGYGNFFKLGSQSAANMCEPGTIFKVSIEAAIESQATPKCRYLLLPGKFEFFLSLP
jgi:hypothetical protein